MFRFTLIALTLSVLLTHPALAHDGRRFEVKVIDNQLVAHGYISDGVTDQGSNLPVANPGDPLYRTYTNAIHGHFTNGGASFAFSTLPGYDILGNADTLIGHNLMWEAVSFQVWSTPDTTGPVVLSDLTPGEWFEVTKGGQFYDSRTGPGSIELVGTIGGSNVPDIDLSYGLNGANPIGEIHVIQSRLTTTAPGIADSETIYTILSPAGATMVERLHHPSLFTEQFFGTPVPEPTTLAALALLPLMMRRRRTA